MGLSPVDGEYGAHNPLKEEPISPETQLPSEITVVTSNQSCSQPLTDYGENGIVASLSFAKLAF
jgi:hypothetical protein